MGEVPSKSAKKKHRGAKFVAALVIIVVLAAFLFYEGYINTIASSIQNNVFLHLTDPANVPAGTQSLTISYSGVQVHVINGNSSGWVNVAGSGSVNLTSLQNVTDTIGSLSAGNGNKIDMLRFNITSASITLNGTTSQVTVPSGRVTVNVVGSNSINGSMTVLTEFTPTVVTIYTANSTIYVLAPSVRAVVVPGVSATGRIKGLTNALTSQERESLDASALNVSISAASLSTSGNVTSFSVTVRDNSNSSLSIMHVLIFGNQNVFLPNITRNGSGDPIGNPTGNPIGNANVTREHEIESSQGVQEEDQRVVNFLVNSSGNLFLPASETEVFNEGYNLTAGQSHTFTFNAPISLGEGNVLVSFINGLTYNIVVQGTEGARATFSIAAT